MEKEALAIKRKSENIFFRKSKLFVHLQIYKSDCAILKEAIEASIVKAYQTVMLTTSRFLILSLT